MNSKQLLERSKNVKEAIYVNIPCQDVDEPLVVIESNDNLFIEPIWIKPVDDFEGPLYAKYIEQNPKYNSIYVRESVESKLHEVAEKLVPRYKLVVRAGHRPIAVQESLLLALIEKFKSEHPRASEKQALDYARTFVSDPGVRLPPHCCGAAVDIDMIDNETGQLVDFGCPVNTASEIAYMHTKKITQSQYNNRLVLLDAMLSAGFASDTHEWWHYSYGDQDWANFYNKPSALYGITEPKL